MNQRTTRSIHRCALASLAIMAGLLASGPAPAAVSNAEPVLLDNVPGTYTVQRGDTLWDISGRFLRDPWRWRDVWEGNQQIRNPDLIYPGDEVFLSKVEGRTRLKVRRKRGGVIKLSPSVRSAPLSEAITTVPLESIHQFLVRPAVVTEEEFEGSPYIVSVGREALLAHAGSRIYARGIKDETLTRFGIFRRGRPFVDPDRDDEVIGFETLRVGEALLDEVADPSRLVVTRPLREVLTGDRLMPLRDDQIATRFVPRPPDSEQPGRIISLVDAVARVGPNQMVVLNIGARDGVESGYVYRVMSAAKLIDDSNAESFVRPADDNAPARIERDPSKQGGAEGLAQAVNRAGASLADRVLRHGENLVGFRSDQAQVELPEERVGLIMVVQPFEKVSYALVMEASGAIRLHDRERVPE